MERIPASTNSMWALVTSSRRPGETFWPALLASLLVSGGWAGIAPAKVFLSVDEALALAFPHCQVERGTAYLSEAQVERARELSGEEIPSALVHSYRAEKNGEWVGTAYFDVHRVRTLPETLMIVVDPQGSVSRVEILSFREPEDYIPRPIWYQQFQARPLDDTLRVKRGIHPVTGATLTARATTQAVRRVLALHEVLVGSDP